MTMLMGPRLVLRDVVPSDEGAIREIAADPALTRYADLGLNDDHEIERFLIEAVAEPQDPARWSYNLAAVVAASGQLVGTVRIWITDAEHRRREIGFAFR